jgi:twinfilin-like protein
MHFKGIAKDEVKLLKSEQVAGNELPQKIPETQPSFTVYDHQGTYVFLYACPSKSVIKERMVYSTSKSSVLSTVEEALGVAIKIKVNLYS